MKVVLRSVRGIRTGHSESGDPYPRPYSIPTRKGRKGEVYTPG